MPRTWSLVAAFGLALVLVAARPSHADPLKLRINWSVTPSHLTPLIPLLPKSVYRHYGKSYVVEPVLMRGTGPAITALATGDVDIAALSYQGFALALVNAKLDCEAIADVLQDRPPNVSDSFWVRRDSGINRVEDLRGKVIGVNARGSGVDAGARMMLSKHGLGSENDYHIVEVRFPAMLPALESKRIDAGFLVNPFDFMAEKTGNYRPLFSLRDAMGPQVTVVWVAKRSFIAAHRAVIVDLLEDQILGRHWLGTHRPEMAQLLSQVTKRPARNFASWVGTRKEADYHSPDLTFDVATLQHNVDELVQLDALPTSVPVASHVDLSMAKQAAARVGMH